MDKILDLIFKLVEKKPSSVMKISDQEITATYGDMQFAIYSYDMPEYQLRVDSVLFNDDLSEKDYMTLKLKLLDWIEVSKEEAIAKLKEFIDVPNGTMDDLLND